MIEEISPPLPKITRNNHRDVSIFIVEIKIPSVIPRRPILTTSIMVRTITFRSRVCQARPPIRGASFELFWCLKPREQHSLDRLHGRRMHGIPSTWNRGVWTRFYGKSTTSRFVRPCEFWETDTAGIVHLPSSSRYENPSPDPSRIISRVENLENVSNVRSAFRVSFSIIPLPRVFGVSNVVIDRGRNIDPAIV